jgi:hypothetical protein
VDWHGFFRMPALSARIDRISQGSRERWGGFADASVLKQESD